MEENYKEMVVNKPTEQEMQEVHENYMNWLRNNPNNFSHWFPHLSVAKRNGIAIPETHIVKVPEEVFPAFWKEKKRDAKTIRLWAHKAILPIIKQHFAGKDVFMKNGCFSGKFNFSRCCHIPADATLKEIVAHLAQIQYDSLCNDTAGNLEIVLREWIRPQSGTRTIYNGMPLRAEMRLFYDFDNHKPLYWVNYWEWNYCHDAICYKPQDKEVYEEYYPYIDEEVELYTQQHWPTICKALQEVTGLKGVWSVDFILEEKKVWLIDAAIGRQSAYWDDEKIKKAQNEQS